MRTSRRSVTSARPGRAASRSGRWRSSVRTARSTRSRRRCSDEPLTTVAAMTEPGLAERRLDVVREHMESENVHDFDRTIGTFAHPRYELMATGDVFDGEQEVRGYFAKSRGDFPDQRNENTVLRSTDDGVIAEFDLLGTHSAVGTSF